MQGTVCGQWCQTWCESQAKIDRLWKWTFITPSLNSLTHVTPLSIMGLSLILPTLQCPCLWFIWVCMKLQDPFIFWCLLVHLLSFQAMFWTPHIIFELHSLGYDTLPIQNVPFVLIKFNVDVLLKLPQVENSKSHSSEMQGLMLPSHLHWQMQIFLSQQL